MSAHRTPAERALLGACRTARVVLQRSRFAVIRAHSMPPESLNPASITNKAAKVTLAEHDRALAALDTAIAKATRSAS